MNAEIAHVNAGIADVNAQIADVNAWIADVNGEIATTSPTARSLATPQLASTTRLRPP